MLRAGLEAWEMPALAESGVLPVAGREDPEGRRRLHHRPGGDPVGMPAVQALAGGADARQSAGGGLPGGGWPVVSVA
jgi:hypothetical protein